MDYGQQNAFGMNPVTNRRMIRAIILLAILQAGILQSSVLQAQRLKYRSDSTVYALTPADTLVAGRYTLYRLQNGTLQRIRIFPPAPDSSFFIRDFDFWDTHNWWVLTGSKFYSGRSVLYRTADAGVTWQEDTSYYAASQHRSLNQVQIIDRQTAYLFDNYYMSDVLKSTDGGITWKIHLRSFAQNHYGVFVCNDSTHYLWGTFGDGFPAYMFPMPTWPSNEPYFSRCDLDSGCVVTGNENGAMPEPYFRALFNNSICPEPQLHTYIFSGSGFWDNPANWELQRMPPFQLSSGNRILVAPVPDGECILNVTQVIQPGAVIELEADRRFRIEGGLLMK